MLAETHKDNDVTERLINDMAKIGWQCTASSARQSAKSKVGNVGGVAAAASYHIDNRLLSIAVDAGGRRTPNPFVTGR